MPQIPKELITRTVGMIKHGTVKECEEVVTMLQALLEKPEVEPVAWMQKKDNSIRHYFFDAGEILAAHATNWTPLYTHPPAPRKPITADMVTDEMIHNWHANTFGAQATGGVSDRDMIAAAVNAYLGANK